jgi:hypothetical protein
MCVILLVVGVLALVSPLDPLGTPGAVLIVGVAVGGLIELTRRMRRH